MFHRIKNPLLIVHADAGDIFTVNHIVQQNGWHVRSLYLSKPVVMQTKSKQKARRVVVGPHVVFIAALGFSVHGKRHNGNIPSFRSRFQLKAQDNIIAELFDLFIIHIFDEDADSCQPRTQTLALLWNISHFHSGI